MTNDLVTFLRARLDDDVEAAESVHVSWCARVLYDSACDCVWPERVLREVEATRRIVDVCVHTIECEDYGYTLAESVLRLLALPYDAHPDYRRDWVPQD